MIFKKKKRHNIFWPNFGNSGHSGPRPGGIERGQKKRPSRKHHRKQPVAASRLTNTQTYNLKNKRKGHKVIYYKNFIKNWNELKTKIHTKGQFPWDKIGIYLEGAHFCSSPICVLSSKKYWWLSHRIFFKFKQTLNFCF